MNETQQQQPPNRNISQSTNLPTHLANSNGLPTSCAASTSSAAQINNHTFTTTPTKNDNLKSQTSQPQTPQFKTLQLIPSSNHLVSASQGNCVVVQQVSNSNHSLSFQHLSSPEHSQNQSCGQTIYRQKNQTFVNSRPQTGNQANANTVNQNGEGNGAATAANIQQNQISARYLHQFQDGRQLQMIQIPNNAQYVQLSNAPGQNGQSSQIMTYVHPQQQQFVARNGGQTQNVIIASQAQDGSRTLQAVPAQIHTIQHTVSPQNASFHLTQSSLKNVKPLNPSTQPSQQQQQQQQSAQNRKPEFVHPQNNGTQNATSNQPQNQSNSDGQQSQAAPQTTESPKIRSKAKTTPNKPKPKVLKTSPSTQQITNHVGQPTATIQQIALPVNAQIRPPLNSNIKGKEKGPPAPVRTVTSFVQIQQPSSQPLQQQTQNSQQPNQEKPQQLTIAQTQQIPANTVVQSVQKTVQITQQMVQKSELQQPQPQQISQEPSNQQTIIVQQNQTQVSTTKTTVQAASQIITTAKIPAVPTIVKARTTLAQPKSTTADADAVSPIPNDPSSGALSKLNLDLTGGDPKDSYRVLKKHFKFLVYENECYQGQLRDSHQRLLKLERDNNYLMDRLLKYETLSDSDGDESDSSIKTIEDKVLTQKTTKKRPPAKKDSSAPPRKKANIASKSSVANNNNPTPLPKISPPTTSKAPVSAASKPVAKPNVVKDSPGSSKPSTSSSSAAVAAIPSQSTNNTSIQSTSSSTLSVFQANMPLPSIYKPFPPSNTSTISTPSTPTTTTTDTSFVTPALPKTNGPVVAATAAAAKKPVLATPKPALPKAKVMIADLPIKDNRAKLPHNSPTTSVTSSSGTGTDIPESKIFTVVPRAPFPSRNPNPQSNATVTYSTLKPNAMIPRPIGQMPSKIGHPSRPSPKIQIIQPSSSSLNQQQQQQSSQQYNIQQQNSKLRPQSLKDNSIIKKESPTKPNS
jgi:hypothetical protein